MLNLIGFLFTLKNRLNDENFLIYYLFQTAARMMSKNYSVYTLISKEPFPMRPIEKSFNISMMCVNSSGTTIKNLWTI